jgi:6-phosphogluconolactonase
MSQKADLLVLPDSATLFRSAAELFVDVLANARSGTSTVALPGGSTPRSLFQLLTEDYRDSLDWKSVHFFWGDERFVAHTHDDSNFGMAKRFLLDPLGIRPEQIHAAPTHLDSPETAALEYEREIRAFFGEDRPPRFDLILLGLGTDAHTASLFPSSGILKQAVRLVAASFVEDLKSWRITFTFPLINQAAAVAFLISGEGKAAALRNVLEKEIDVDKRPAQGVRPKEGRLVYLTDRDAAGLLNR